MIKITEIKISRFRSINEMIIKIDPTNNICSICGQNNVGKTNILRAINLFFRPYMYNYKLDVPNFKQANEYGGGSVYTVISMTFLDTSNDTIYSFTRDFKAVIARAEESLKKCFKILGKTKEEISVKNAEIFISKLKVFFIESIDDIVFETINDIADDVLEIKYANSRFSDSRIKLKESYDEYIDGMQEILDDFAKQISGTFTNFNPNWAIHFTVPKNSNSFKELITKDVEFNLYDKGVNGIINKGAGLQRLALILLQFEAIKRMKRTSAIVLIDEPDLYIHEGLQRKFKRFLDEMAKNIQIIYTTHSPVFVDTYKMKNTFLIELKSDTKSVKGKDETFYFSENIDLKDDGGYEKICDHLGVIHDIAEPLQGSNILVEGESDKNYLTELAKYFGLNNVNIQVANGVSRIPKWLNFYESFYKNVEGKKPKIKVLFDNDSAGRQEYKSIDISNYTNIQVEKILLNNCFGNANLATEKNSTNNEIEDFIYPEVICFLVNKMLSKKKMKRINEKQINVNISKPAFTTGGILVLIENAKNLANPETGADIIFSSSSYQCERVKTGLSAMFKVELNSQLINIINSVKDKYPKVEEFLKELFSFDS